ncbi:MAG: hypothetical protein ACRCSF_13890, partial [Mycobacteriaceae bacterium]
MAANLARGLEVPVADIVPANIDAIRDLPQIRFRVLRQACYSELSALSAALEKDVNFKSSFDNAMAEGDILLAGEIADSAACTGNAQGFFPGPSAGATAPFKVPFGEILYSSTAGAPVPSIEASYAAALIESFKD